MANPERLEILSQGVEPWNRWREENPDTQPDLDGARLFAEDFSGAADYVAECDVTARRGYVTRPHIHQRSFREKALRAYRQQCALCRLRHAELLCGAHIIPASEEGPPIVRNGLALCKLGPWRLVNSRRERRRALLREGSIERQREGYEV